MSSTNILPCGKLALWVRQMRTGVKPSSPMSPSKAGLRGRSHRGSGARGPAIIMAHGFSAVKEMYLDAFAERFVAAGFVTLVFDYRYQGASEGEPRGRIIPAEQHEDYRNAITWVSLRPEVDASRIGVWGSSQSGAHVLHLAAFDKRIKTAVSQVPLVNGMQNAQRLLRADVLAQFIYTLAQDRVQRYTQGAVNY